MGDTALGMSAISVRCSVLLRTTRLRMAWCPVLVWPYELGERRGPRQLQKVARELPVQVQASRSATGICGAVGHRPSAVEDKKSSQQTPRIDMSPRGEKVLSLSHYRAREALVCERLPGYPACDAGRAGGKISRRMVLWAVQFSLRLNQTWS